MIPQAIPSAGAKLPSPENHTLIMIHFQSQSIPPPAAAFSGSAEWLRLELSISAW
jgi:hypothetical protein